jgi:hypothetical protein
VQNSLIGLTSTQKGFAPNRKPSFSAPAGGHRDQPFVNPDVFRPANPHVPGIFPSYPDQPKWITPFPSGPIIEVPNDSPVELPSSPRPDDWVSIPTPDELPDWSKAPAHFPAPGGAEINLPQQFPYKSNPSDGTWLLS